jgi:hypothetical protein
MEFEFGRTDADYIAGPEFAGRDRLIVDIDANGTILILDEITALAQPDKGMTARDGFIFQMQIAGLVTTDDKLIALNRQPGLLPTAIQAL